MGFGSVLGIIKFLISRLLRGSLQTTAIRFFTCIK